MSRHANFEVGAVAAAFVVMSTRFICAQIVNVNPFGNGSEEDISKIVHRVIIWLISFVLSDCPDVQDQDFLNDEARTKTRKYCRDSKPDPEEEESQRAESGPGCQERPGKEAGSQEVAADGQSQERRQGREGVASWQSSC